MYVVQPCSIDGLTSSVGLQYGFERKMAAFRSPDSMERPFSGVRGRRSLQALVDAWEEKAALPADLQPAIDQLENELAKSDNCLVCPFHS